VGEIQPSHNGAQRGVDADVGEEFAEDAGVGNSDLRVQGGEGGRVQRTGGEEKRHQVDVAGGEAIRRDISYELINYCAWER